MSDPAEWITGVRLSLYVLWASIIWRLIFETGDLHTKGAAILQRAFMWARVGLGSLGVSVIVFYNTENVLRANGYMSAETGLWWVTTGSFLQAFALCLVLTALDIASGRRARALPVYLAITAAACAWVLVR